MGKTLARSEKSIENEILNWLEWKKIYVWKTKTVGTFNHKRMTFQVASRLYRTGVADIIGILPNGRLLAIEVKSKKGAVQDNQRMFLKEVTDRGALAFVARSVDDVEENLTKAGFAC